MRYLFLLCWAVFALLSVRAQTILHVAPGGNDKGPGTKAAPLGTVHRAVAMACARKGEKVVILLKGGTYYLEKELLLQAADMACNSLEVGVYGDDPVYISAGRRLTLQWKQWKNGIFTAAIPKGVVFERLYVNGRLQVLARYPNYDSTARVFHGVAADALERAARWQHPENGYIHGLHAGEWGGFHYRVTGIKGNKPVLEGGWQNNRPDGLHKAYRFAENNLDELDAAGEWYLDRSASRLYYYPPPGLELARALIEVSNLKRTIILKGDASRPLRNVSLRGLTFVHNERTFMDTREPLLRSDWTIYRGGALLLDGTENCVVANCRFADLGGNAIMLSNYNYRDTITGCYIHHTGASAVCFVGDVKAVRSPSFRYEDYTPYAQLDKTPGPASNNYPRECAVINNLIHHVGEIEKQATGVQISISSAITVSHNTIYNTPRAGINIGDGCFGGHLVEYNDVFNTVLETGDHGAFNSWGRDRYWSPDRKYMDSITATHPELILLDAQQTTIIRNNRFRCDHGWDIDLDDGSSNYHIYNNVCLNGGLKLREGFYRVVENNIIVNNSFHPHVWFSNSGDVFERNIVTRKYFPIQVQDWGRRIDHNLFPDTLSMAGSRRRVTDMNSIAGDPMFARPEQGDYTVLPASPALHTGFRNFPMDSFGVMLPALRSMAAQPEIPVFTIPATAARESAAGAAFLNGIIKSISGPGERSAYGLPDESGVVVLQAGANSLLAASGLKAGDVIRMADGRAVKSVKDLLDLAAEISWKAELRLSIIRDQQPLELTLRLK